MARRSGKVIEQSLGADGETRVRLPKKNELFAVVETMLGFDRLRVMCADQKERLCRIPGKMKKRVWIKAGDLTIVELSDIEHDKKGTITYRYTKTQAKWLERNGHLKDVELDIV